MVAEELKLGMGGKPKELKPASLKYKQILDQRTIYNPGTTPEVLKKALDNIDLQHPEVLKPQLLRSLYDVLDCLLSDSPYCSNFRGSDYVVMGIHQFDWDVKFTDICNLSNFLFKELSRRFNQLFAGLGLVPANAVLGQSIINSVAWEATEDLFLLLRCCMVIVHLLEFNQALLLEKCEVLLDILRKLCSQELMAHITASSSPFLCSIFEVFIDELLARRQLREYFMMIDTVSSTNDKLFMCNLSHGDSDAVLELISAHFLLSVSDELSFKNSFDTLFKWHGEESSSLELSLSGAMQLLGTPIMFAGPQMLQAYMTSLVARCIDMDMPLENKRLDRRLVNCYMSSFERSFVLYSRHMLSLQYGYREPKSRSASRNRPFILEGGYHPSFESYIRPATYSQINEHITKFADSRYYLFSKKKLSLVTACGYMNQNQHILAKSHKDETVSLLSYIISRTLSTEAGTDLYHISEDVTQQELYLLSSTVQLMSSSLLQSIRCMQSGSLGCLKTLKDYSQSEEYDFIVGIIGRFQQFNVSYTIQKIVFKETGAFAPRHKESKQMFMHFVDLLRFSFDSEFEILWKGCIFMMMTLMNLFIFEEGNLDAVGSWVGCKLESLPSECSSNEISKIHVGRKSSFRIASKFRNIQMLNMRENNLICHNLWPPSQSESPENPLLIKDVEESVLNIVEDNTCNGEIFLKCLHVGKSDIDELADFIVCQQGKDYSSWLKDREKYRKWKYKKVAVIKRERKKRSLQLLKGLL